MATPITSLTSNDTFQTWFNTTNTIISTVNGITTSPGGITGPYVISFNGLTGDVVFTNYVSNFNGLTGAVSGLTGTIAGNGITITGSSTYPTISNSGVLSVNGASGVIQNIAVTNAAQVFQTLQEFIGGISANGATFSGNISAPNVLTTNGANVFTTLQQFTGGISANGATFSGNITATNANFSGNISAPNIVNSFNGSTGTILFNNYLTSFNGLTGVVSGVSTLNGLTGNVSAVSSFNGLTGNVDGVSSFNGLTGTVSGVSTFNGLTGAVTGVTTSIANTFTALQGFAAGITTSTLYVTTLTSLASPATVIAGLTLAIYSDNTIVGNSTSDIITLTSGQVIRTLSTNTAATTAISILEYPITSYSSAEFLIQGERYTTGSGTLGTQTVKILMSATCGSSSYSVSHVEYGNVTNGSSVATYTVDLSGGTWRLRVTPTSSNTMRFRTVATLYPNVGGIGSIA
jgi:hypothetical protein